MTTDPSSVPVELIARIVAMTVMILGFLVIPFLPGLVIIWVAALGYGIAAGFGTLGWIMFALITLLMVGGSILDNVLIGTRTHKEGAPWWVVLIALASAVIGNFIIPIPIVGGVLVALLVLFIIQYMRLKNVKQALTSLRGMLVGCGLGVIFRVIIGGVMISLWLIWAWF
jgi:uncharacterized protein